jgi:hypothetical protein
LGSEELNLLAGIPAALTPAAADEFYFYSSRILAAQNVTDPQAKVQLLSHCIIDFPRRDEARVPLFKAAVTAHSDEYAVAALEPLFQTRFLRNYVPQNGREEEPTISSGEEEDGSGAEAGVREPATTKLSRAQQAEVAGMIGDAMTRLGRTAEALSYYQSARRLETSAEIRKILFRKTEAAKSVLRIQHQNAARQPLLHEALEQDRVVRPRVLARSTPVPKAAAKGGVQ